MKCQRCGEAVEPGEERQHLGQTLCEDCYMDVLSPPKGCDPWAVYTAKSFPKGMSEEQLTPLQVKILGVLRETGGLEPGNLIERLQVKPSDLERDLAALRHMEKIRGELRSGKRFIVLW